MNIYITNFNADFKNMYVCQAWINFHNTLKKKTLKCRYACIFQGSQKFYA